jgi:hypothetical protein
MPHLSRGVEQPAHSGLSGARFTRPKERDAHGGAVVCRKRRCHLQHLGVEREGIPADLFREILKIGVEIALARASGVKVPKPKDCTVSVAATSMRCLGMLWTRPETSSRMPG